MARPVLGAGPLHRFSSNQDGRARCTLRFEYPLLAQAWAASWRLELLSSVGEALLQEDVVVQVDWAGRKVQPGLADGSYRLRLTAVSREASRGFPPSPAQPEFVERVLAEAQAQPKTRSRPS